jgi:hypothetical protein
MVSFVKHNSFVQSIARAVMNLNTDSVKIALTNSDPTGQETLGAITEITAHNGYSAGGAAITGQSATQTSGTLTFTGTGPTITASGGTIGPFRYAYMYDATDASHDAIGHWDYGSNLTLNDGDSVTFTISGSGILTIA